MTPKQRERFKEIIVKDKNYQRDGILLLDYAPQMILEYAVIGYLEAILKKVDPAYEYAPEVRFCNKDNQWVVLNKDRDAIYRGLHYLDALLTAHEYRLGIGLFEEKEPEYYDYLWKLSNRLCSSDKIVYEVARKELDNVLVEFQKLKDIEVKKEKSSSYSVRETCKTCKGEGTITPKGFNVLEEKTETCPNCFGTGKTLSSVFKLKNPEHIKLFDSFFDHPFFAENKTNPTPKWPDDVTKLFYQVMSIAKEIKTNTTKSSINSTPKKEPICPDCNGKGFLYRDMPEACETCKGTGKKHA